MNDIELAEDRGGVGGQDHLLEMIDNDLVATVGTKRGLNRRGDGTAGLDVAQNGAILGIVARFAVSILVAKLPSAHDGGVTELSPVVALFEKALVGRVGDVERHDSCVVGGRTATVS